MGKIDAIDRRLIAALQEDAGASVAAIGERIGLSQNACWRRIRRLEDDGFLIARVALFDADKLGASLTAFAHIRVSEHDPDWLVSFARAVTAMPEVVEFYRMSGDIDYMTKILVRDVQHYDVVYKRLIAVGGISDISSSFAMEEIKYTTAVPVPA